MNTWIVIAIVICSLTAIGSLISLAISKAKKFNYTVQIACIESCVKNFVVTRRNFIEIGKMLDDISRYDINPERTKLIRDEFKDKYKDFIVVPVKEFEVSPN